ncbi:mpv17-like protein 2 [Diorhabda carinulata]|uniref:mpv17-like protein 2 n=1 Tax=Diorhabda carinulata TaxID=1163345 RepID=UPI0025A01CC5|nr:mpv17-like protein 2 [Diorhabda carinulata]
MHKIFTKIVRSCKSISKFHSSRRYVAKDNTKNTPVRAGVSILFSKKYLLLSNTVTSGLLMFIGDLCQQEIEFRQKLLEKRYDFKRLTHMFIVGLALGPPHHYYYIGIAKKWPQRTTKIILWKIMLDQFVMSPLCIVAFFFGLNALEMKPLKEVVSELQNKFYTVYLVDWIIWPPTQYLNFYLVPVKYQVLYINAVTMLYNVFLSFMKYKPEDMLLNTISEVPEKVRKD